MRITTKGQVTIPMEIRESMGLLPHTQVKFVVKGNCVYLEKEASTRGKTLIQSMRGKGEIKMTTDEIMSLTRGEK